MSKASIEAGVQAALALCATCAHVRGASHPEDGRCIDTRTVDGAERQCECEEFWPIEVEYFDGRRILDHEVSLSGGDGWELDRRAAKALWTRLRMGNRAVLRVIVEAEGLNRKPHRVKGVLVGVDEVRKVRVVAVVKPWVRGPVVDPETGEVIDEELDE